jgi:orotidine-5'-phosphate decarboxylase
MVCDVKIFCAIDIADLKEAVSLAAEIGPVTGGLKLGLEFFSAFGPQGVEKVREACPDAALFLDLKFHDIPHTVAGAVRTITRNLAPTYLNIHAAGGAAMMAAARDSCAPATRLLGVTILTSLDQAALQQAGFAGEPESCVERLALLSKKSGLAGVVCSAHEIETVRTACGPDFVLMVPGIRPAGADPGDQKRVMTPEQALALGATHLVIGRPITAPAGGVRPADSARAIVQSLK